MYIKTVKNNEKELINKIKNTMYETIEESTGYSVNKNDLDKKKFLELIESIEKKDGNYGVAFTEDKKITGYVFFGPSGKDIFSNSKNNKHGFIYDIYVYKKFRNKGIGKRLMNFAFDNLKKEGYDEVRLNVFYNNKKAKKLYEKMGFEKYSSIFRKKL